MQKVKDSHRNLEKEEWGRSYSITNTYHKVTVIKSMWYWGKDNQTNGTTWLTQKFRNTPMHLCTHTQVHSQDLRQRWQWHLIMLGRLTILDHVEQNENMAPPSHNIQNKFQVGFRSKYERWKQTCQNANERIFKVASISYTEPKQREDHLVMSYYTRWPGFSCFSFCIF